MKAAIFLLAFLLTALSCPAQNIAVDAINTLGLDLLRQTGRPDANTLLSPYSIQVAMAMVYAGAAGQTRDEMARVLHFPPEQNQVDQSFTALQAGLDGVMQRQAAQMERLKKYGINSDPLTLTTANRVFAQKDYDFRPAYLASLREIWHSPLDPMDFRTDALGATKIINDWVAGATHERIQNLIPPGALNWDTRLVLVNAIYLKAPWQNKFSERDTQPRSFNLSGGTAVQAATMFLHHSFGYARRDGCQCVTIPYSGGDIQLVIILPDATNGLAALEAGLKSEMLAACANLPQQDVELFLPKFTLTPPAISLASAFQSLGMKTAFDLPPGSANFYGMAPRRVDDYLYISDIFHKTYLKLDETGTEAAAAAATSVGMAMAAGIMMPPPKPIEVHVDRPFLFAIQDRVSGACLFLGHVTDPR